MSLSMLLMVLPLQAAQLATPAAAPSAPPEDGAAVTFTLPTAAQKAPAHPQVDDEMDRMRFMIGEWDVNAWFRNSPSTYARGQGTISVRIDEVNQVLIAEMHIPFPGFTVEGTTLRRFNEARQIWEVEWIDKGNPAASEPTIDGQFRNGRFLEINYGEDERGPWLGRLVIFDMTEESFSVRKDIIWDDGTIALENWAYEARKVR